MSVIDLNAPYVSKKIQDKNIGKTLNLFLYDKEQNKIIDKISARTNKCFVINYSNGKTEKAYSIEIEKSFKKEFIENKVKQLWKFKIPYKIKNVKQYKKFVELPYRFLTPDFYSTWWPINIVYEEELNDNLYLLNVDNFYSILNEKEYENFSEKIKKEHIEIIYRKDLL